MPHIVSSALPVTQPSMTHCSVSVGMASCASTPWAHDENVARQVRPEVHSLCSLPTRASPSGRMMAPAIARSLSAVSNRVSSQPPMPSPQFWQNALANAWWADEGATAARDSTRHPSALPPASTQFADSSTYASLSSAVTLPQSVRMASSHAEALPQEACWVSTAAQ